METSRSRRRLSKLLLVFVECKDRYALPMLLVVEDVICGDVVSFSASEGLFELNLNRGEQIWPSASLLTTSLSKCPSYHHQSWAHADADDEGTMSRMSMMKVEILHRLAS